MALMRCGRWMVPALVLVACARGRPAGPSPTTGGLTPSSTLLPPVPSRTGPLNIQVAYPPTDASLQVRDSTFILGSVGSGDARLTINGEAVPVWPNGAWLAYVALAPDTVARFQLEARTSSDSASLTYVVRRTIDQSTPPPGAPVWVDSLSLSPRGRLWLHPDEYLTLSVRATEGAAVHLRLPDGTVIPLVAQPQLNEVPEAVRMFGAGHPDAWRPRPVHRAWYGGDRWVLIRDPFFQAEDSCTHRASRRQRVGDRRGHRGSRYGASALAASGRFAGQLPVVDRRRRPRTSVRQDSLSIGRAAPGSDITPGSSQRRESRGERTSRWGPRVRLSRDAEAWLPAAIPISSSRGRPGHAESSESVRADRVPDDPPSGSR